MSATYWTCRRCSYRNLRAHLKCRGYVTRDGAQAYCTGRRPPKHVPKHAVALRDNSYAEFARLNDLIHGAGESCGVCGKEPHQLRHLDRDHGHNPAENSFGKPRGLACPGNQGCNALMPRQLTLERARAIVAYLERVEQYYAKEDS